MNRFYRWILKKICKRLVVQGHGHEENIIQYFVIMNNAAEKQFTEDSKSALFAFIEKCHKDSLWITFCRNGDFS